jgi:hypothetical protein
MRFDLQSYKDQVRFKIEIIPQAKDAQGNAIEKRFDYKNSLSMIFGLGEILRLRKFAENILNPAKVNGDDIPELKSNQENQPKRYGYKIDHYFDVPGQGGATEKKKSTITLTRAENRVVPESPYRFKYNIMCSIYSSFKNSFLNIAFTEEEAYWFLTETPYICWAFMAEKGRIDDENRAIAKGQSKTSIGSTGGYETASNPQPQPQADHEIVDAPEAGTKEPPSLVQGEINFSDISFDKL